MKKATAITITVLLLLVILYFSFAYFQADQLIHNYPVTRKYVRSTPADFGMTEYQDIKLKTSDGLNLAAWYVPPKNHAVIIVQHGYKSCRQEALPVAAMLSEKGYGVLMMDARGHGSSDGDTITFGKNEVKDIRAGLDYLLARPEVDKNRIATFGFSQGGATTLLAAGQFPEIAAAVADSAYYSLSGEIEVGIRKFAHLPPDLFAPVMQFFAERLGDFRVADLSAEAACKNISPRALYLVQGGIDDTVPTESGKMLYEAAKEPKELWFVPNANHCESRKIKPVEYKMRIMDFYKATSDNPTICSIDSQTELFFRSVAYFFEFSQNYAGFSSYLCPFRLL